jgi:hypothetical protein
MKVTVSAEPAWVGRLVDELDAADRRAIMLAGDLSESQLNWRPSPHSWSIGQCLLHLLNSNVVYLPPIARALDGVTPSPVAEITHGFLGAWFIRTYIEPSTQKKKGRSPRKVKPAPEAPADVLDRFVKSNDQARELVRRAGPYDVNRLRFVNPFVPLLRFTVGTGLEIVSRHERRHLRQGERVRKQLGFPKD